MPRNSSIRSTDRWNYDSAYTEYYWYLLLRMSIHHTGVPIMHRLPEHGNVNGTRFRVLSLDFAFCFLRNKDIHCQSLLLPLSLYWSSQQYIHRSIYFFFLEHYEFCYICLQRHRIILSLVCRRSHDWVRRNRAESTAKPQRGQTQTHEPAQVVGFAHGFDCRSPLGVPCLQPSGGKLYRQTNNHETKMEMMMMHLDPSTDALAHSEESACSFPHYCIMLVKHSTKWRACRNPPKQNTCWPTYPTPLCKWTFGRNSGSTLLPFLIFFFSLSFPSIL